MRKQKGNEHPLFHTSVLNTNLIDSYSIYLLCLLNLYMYDIGMTSMCLNIGICCFTICCMIKHEYITEIDFIMKGFTEYQVFE
jgi:hypothetical protein